MAGVLIRQRVEALMKALRAKDIDGITSLYAPNLVSFDIAPPLRSVGADNKRRAWQEAFAAFTGPISYEVRDLNVTTHGDLARSQPQPRERQAGERSHHRPVVALDSMLPANRWRLAGRARPRVSPCRPRAWPGCSDSHALSSVAFEGARRQGGDLLRSSAVNPILVIGGTGTVGRQVVSQLLARGVRIRALARNPATTGLPPQVDVVRGDLTLPRDSRWMPRRHRRGIPRLDRAAVRCGSRVGTDPGARTAHRLPFSSDQDGAPALPAAQSAQSHGRTDRAVDRGIRTPVDVLAAGDVRRECAGLVGAADSRRRRRALALPRRSNGPDR